MSKNKQQVITFKADAGLVDAISRIPNRSEFIREALLAALENTCPVCNGTGQLTPHQKLHWTEFMRDHLVQKCSECHELHLVCGRPAHAPRPRSREARP